MKMSFSRCIFDLIKNEPHLTDAEVHTRMSLDPEYKINSGKSLVYRMLCAKYVHRDKNGRLTALVSNYAPLPPYKPRPKKKAKVKAMQDSGLAAAAKAQQVSRSPFAKQYRIHQDKEMAAMNTYNSPYRNSSDMTQHRLPASENVTKPEAKTFWRKLRELFSD